MSATPPASTRMAVLWCPDWPVVVWGVPLDEPSAVLEANRVVAASPAARSEGVVRGMRRRDAQAICPDLGLLERDVEREVRRFEPIAAALDDLTPRVEVVVPGVVGFPTRGPARLFGGDEAVAARMAELARPHLPGDVDPRVGVADGGFAARLAARSPNSRSDPHIVAPGASAEFLSALPIGVLGRPELVGVLQRLGLVTLGAFAELDAADVVGRFGADGLVAHRLAQGLDDQPPELRHPAPDRVVVHVFDPPAERVDACAFAAKVLADELHDGLMADGLACVRVMIEAETEAGEVHQRLWRHEGALSASALSDRARWQIDGWLKQSQGRPSSGLARLSLVPDEVVAATGRQLGFWGGRAQRADPVTRVVARLGTMLGPEAVMVPEWRGGRGPGDMVGFVPAAAVDLAEQRPRYAAETWPGGLPVPAPAVVPVDPLEVNLLDAVGESVAVGGRGELSAPPAALVIDRRRRAVLSWAGPWPIDEQWWDPLHHRRRARMQVVLDDRTAHLVTAEHRTWWLEATYD